MNEEYNDLGYLLKEHRVAIFHIHRSYLFDSELRAFLGQCVIIRANQSAMWDCVEYTAYHPDFEPVPEASYPERVWIVSRPDGVIQVEKKQTVQTVGDSVDYEMSKRPREIA